MERKGKKEREKGKQSHGAPDQIPALTSIVPEAFYLTCRGEKDGWTLHFFFSKVCARIQGGDAPSSLSGHGCAVDAMGEDDCQSSNIASGAAHLVRVESRKETGISWDL